MKKFILQIIVFFLSLFLIGFPIPFARAEGDLVSITLTLLDQNGKGVPGGVATPAYGGSWGSQLPGQTDSNGKLYASLPSGYTKIKMTINQSGQEQTLAQLNASNYTWYTVPIVIELRDNEGKLLPGSGSLYSPEGGKVEQGGSYWYTHGYTGDSGQFTVQVFGGQNFKFRMTWEKKSQEITQYIPPEGGIITFQTGKVTLLTGKSLSLGSWVYFPAGTYQFLPGTYNIQGGGSFTVTAGGEVTVPTPANQPPVAKNDNYSTDEDTALSVLTVGVLANDSDPDNDPLEAVLVTGPSHGTLTLNSDGSFTYTPASNFNGTDSFTYKANDGTSDSNLATVTITVNPVNDPPVANDQAVTTDEDTSTAITLTASDVDGNPLTYIVVTPPSHGTLSGTAPNLNYTPDENYYGSDSFTFKVNDTTEDSNTALVSITVVAVNDPPVLDTIGDKTVNEGELLTFSITATDPDGDPLTYSASDLPLGATIDSETGTFSWTPGYDQAGKYTITFTASDGDLSADETIQITVEDVVLQATVDIDPDTLNLKSKGQWITVYIELPKGYDPRQIDLDTVKLNGEVGAVTDPKYGFVSDPNCYLTDKDGDGILERMVKFDRSAVQELFSKPGNYTVTISGQLLGWPAQPDFSGSDTIRVK